MASLLGRAGSLVRERTSPILPEPDSAAPQIAGAKRSGGSVQHPVRCTYCSHWFDLFRADWCKHFADQPSKVCPWCRACVCQHPLYDNPLYWALAPPVFQKLGFRRLFILYV